MVSNQRRGEQRQTGHLHVASRQLRRLVIAAVLQQRIAPGGGDVVIRMALHVVEEPVAQLVGGAPGMPRLDPLETAVGHADAPQSVVLNVVDQFHGKDHAGAERGVDQHHPGAAQPVRERVPRGGLEHVAPERIGIVPHRQVAAGQPVALEAPGCKDIALDLPGQVLPEAHPLGRGPGVPGRAGQGVVNIDVFRRVVRVGCAGQDELAEPALRHGTLMDQLVADDEGGLGHAAQHQRHEQPFQSGQVPRHQDLPEREPQCRRPQHRPQPHRQLVPEQLAVQGLRQVHVPLFRAEHDIEPVREHEENHRRGNPPAALNRGVDHQGKDRQGHEVQEGVPDRRLKHGLRDGAQTARRRHILCHGNSPPFQSLHPVTASIVHGRKTLSSRCPAPQHAPS